jgi:heterodisulfide reductase subunit C
MCPRKVLIVGIVNLFRIVSAVGIWRMIKMLPYFVQILYRI